MIIESRKKKGEFSMNKRMNRNRLNIGAYILQPYARTEQHVKDIAECGIDFIVCMSNDRPALDLFEKHGVGAIVSGIVPGWWGGDGNNAGKMAETNPMEKYDAAASKFEDHPAIWGIDVGDEPSALDFPYYGKVIDHVNKNFPEQFAYLNLYPNYASVAVNTDSQTVNQLGTKTYAEHIEKYCENVNTDYICYDYYPYSASVSGFYENFKIVADACRNTGRSMWIVVQVNSLHKEIWLSEDKLRFQAYSSMAFGAENIIWACYTAGWWNNQVLDENGNKTEQYEKLKKINAEIRAMGDEYMKFRRVSTHFVGGDSETVGQPVLEKLSTGVFMDVKAENGESLVIGQMVSRANDGSYALMICPADDPMDNGGKEYKITFNVRDFEISAFNGKGVKTVEKDGENYTVTVRSNEGILITAKK